VGPRTLLAWVRHYFALAAFSLLHAVAGRWAAKSRSFRLRRWAEAWAWGSGQVGMEMMSDARQNGPCLHRHGATRSRSFRLQRWVEAWAWGWM